MTNWFQNGDETFTKRRYCVDYVVDGYYDVCGWVSGWMYVYNQELWIRPTESGRSEGGVFWEQSHNKSVATGPKPVPDQHPTAVSIMHAIQHSSTTFEKILRQANCDLNFRPYLEVGVTSRCVCRGNGKK